MMQGWICTWQEGHGGVRRWERRVRRAAAWNFDTEVCGRITAPSCETVGAYQWGSEAGWATRETEAGRTQSILPVLMVLLLL